MSNTGLHQIIKDIDSPGIVYEGPELDFSDLPKHLKADREYSSFRAGRNGCFLYVSEDRVFADPRISSYSSVRVPLTEGITKHIILNIEDTDLSKMSSSGLHQIIQGFNSSRIVYEGPELGLRELPNLLEANRVYDSFIIGRYGSGLLVRNDRVFAEPRISSYAMTTLPLTEGMREHIFKSL